MTKYLLPIVLAAWLTSAAGCAQNQNTNSPQSSDDDQNISDVIINSQADDQATGAVEGQTPGSQVVVDQSSLPSLQFNLKVENGRWDPQRIVIKQGRKVEFTVTSVGSAQSFGLDEYLLYQNLLPDQPVKIVFTADKAGAFAYYCSAGCDPETRVNGVFVVQ